MTLTSSRWRAMLVAALLVLVGQPGWADEVRQTIVPAGNAVSLKVRLEGPYTAEVPLQVVCYFRYTEAGARKMKGAPVELDKHLHGVIASLRQRGEFVGDRLESMVL